MSKRCPRPNLRLLLQAIPLTLFVATGCELFHSPGYDWSASFDGMSGQIHQFEDGGYIIVDRGGSKLLRVDSKFRLKWTASYEDFGFSTIRSVLVESDGSYLVTGNNLDFGSTTWMLKADSDGGVLWTREIAGLQHIATYMNYTCRTADRGYVTTGGRDGLIALVKVGWNGTIEWEVFGDTGVGDWVGQTIDHGYLVASARPARLCRFDSTGTVLWARNLQDYDVDWVHYAYIAPGGECVISTTAYRLLKLDAAGNLAWQSTLSDRYGEFSSVQATSDGGFILGGTLKDYDVLLVKTDSVGAEEWSRTCGGKEEEHGFWAEQAMDGGYVVAGTEIWEDWMDLGHSAIRVKKTDANGN